MTQDLTEYYITIYKYKRIGIEVKYDRSLESLESEVRGVRVKFITFTPS